jgi:phosphotriesterase-related protein
LFAAVAGQQRRTVVTGAIIRTVLRDVPPESLGVILFHEHLHLSSTAGNNGGPGAPQPTRHFTEDIDLVIKELRSAASDGVSAFADAGHLDQGRRPGYIRQLSKLSGVPLIMSGGYHSQATYPVEVLRATEDDLVEEMLASSIAERWGALGEIGTSKEITPDERKVLRAVARVHRQTNLPIYTHTALGGLQAIEQLDLLESAGVNPAHLVIGHLGGPTMPPIEVFKTICKRGAFVGFDRVGWNFMGDSDSKQVPVVRELIDSGYTANIMLASDGIVDEGQLKSKGGPGYARAFTVFVPKLRAAGVDEATIQMITIENPRRFFAFVPK